MLMFLMEGHKGAVLSSFQYLTREISLVPVAILHVLPIVILLPSAELSVFFCSEARNWARKGPNQKLDDKSNSIRKFRR